MAGRFDDRVALVTGAASGIGLATALRLHGEGARVIAADRDEAGLKALADRISGLRTLNYDAADGDASAAMAARATEMFGGLDHVVCNAGIYRRAHFKDISAEDWATMLSVNLTSVFRIVQALVPALRESRGSLVTLASTAAVQGIAYAAHYAAAKAAVVALTKSLAIEYASAGIRFNAVAPGRVKTPIGAGLAPLGDQDDRLLTRPVKLVGRPEGGEPAEIAGVIAFLLSADASFVTGSLVVADGAQNLG
ncbi:SDR family oxidoreductase [Aquibium sp. ELW1220]|uniref:SDR family NAD(P)-dependent oxidoreductase n=1 Tax=Aquibium sp. ELW1220 TaxID=2976766 RepID=UPI0025AFBAA2|nr:SDR family oxidoreductase [Aquibium sp. ELW1220]MDN2583312.1 SDR family oxidoreductase [Aquibium sp. ELW1220]